MKILVTGSASHLAAALLPRLCARPEIERVTGVDLDPPRFQHTRFNPLRLDIRNPWLEDLLAIGKEVRGPFNLAVEDNFKLREVANRCHRLAVPLPPFAARSGLNLARRWQGWGVELAWIEVLSRTLLVNCRRAAVELGWRSTHSAASVLAQS